MHYFKEFIAYASEAKLPFMEHMAPGLTIGEVENVLGISCNELDCLYNWRNGITFSENDRFNTELCFFFFGYMVPLEKVKYYMAVQNQIPELSGKKWVLVFESGLGEAYFLDYDRESESYGKIFFYTLDERFKTTLFVLFDSLDSFFEYVLKCYKEGVFVFKDGDFTVTDMDREYDILIEANPGSQYWESLADWWKGEK